MTSRIAEWGYFDRLVDVCALIMQRPRTVYELHDVTEYQLRTISGYVTKLSRHGFIVIVGYSRVGKGRVSRPLYAWSAAHSEWEPRVSKGSIDRMLKVLRMICKAPRTLDELCNTTGYQIVSLRGYIKRLHRGGLIYISCWSRAPFERWQSTWSIQQVPFGLQDKGRP